MTDDYNEELDSVLSYYLAIEEIGKRVKRGDPIPECLLPMRDEEE